MEWTVYAISRSGATHARGRFTSYEHAERRLNEVAKETGGAFVMPPSPRNILGDIIVHSSDLKALSARFGVPWAQVKRWWIGLDEIPPEAIRTMGAIVGQ